jgi:hypothetical protein
MGHELNIVQSPKEEKQPNQFKVGALGRANWVIRGWMHFMIHGAEAWSCWFHKHGWVSEAFFHSNKHNNMCDKDLAKKCGTKCFFIFPPWAFWMIWCIYHRTSRSIWMTRCSHNTTSQKKCQTTKKNSQNWINIYVFPFKAMEIMTNYCFFIWMLKNSNQKSIWWNFKFKFWFKTFKSA